MNKVEENFNAKFPHVISVVGIRNNRDVFMQQYNKQH